MWECQKCHERHEDSFEVCWNCGTSKAGVEDPGFRPADQIEPASLEQPASPPVEENAYEFSPEQNEVIGSLATSMRIVGVLSLLSGSFLVLMLAYRGAPALIEGVLALVVGGFTVKAARAFRQIVDSQRDDIGHLMTALAALRSLYGIQAFLLSSILCLVLGLLALAFLQFIAYGPK
jgi:hypothetical protein